MRIQKWADSKAAVLSFLAMVMLLPAGLFAQGVAIDATSATSENLKVIWNANDPERIDGVYWNAERPDRH